MKNKLALCLIVKGTDEEAILLDRCLTNMEKHVDGIFITRTYLDEKNAKVAEVVKKHNGVLSDFKWVYDFSEARNFNFSQVPKEYTHVMWSDADDIWRGLENLKSTIDKHPHMDGFGMWYLYDWDESKLPTVVHRKTMVIKNDGCAVWKGAIHEDLEPTRQLEVELIEGIDRLHLSTEKRAKDNAERNLEISRKEAKKNPDDPRSHWNLANSEFGTSRYEDARDSFIEFIKSSQSQEEIYLAHTRLADVYKAMGDRTSSIKELQIAIGIEPTIPDAYFQLSLYYYTYGDMDKAEQYCIQGLIKRPQIMKMVVYNPRDYDYNPMMLLAKIYYAKNRPDLMLPLLEGCLKIYPKDKHLKKLVSEGKEEKEMLGKALTIVQKLQKIADKVKLKKELDKVPESLKSHPAIAVIRNTNFVKDTSTGKDLVYYCGNTTHQWNAELFKTKGFGGSEEAVIKNAKEFAKMGWNVTVYNNCGSKSIKTNGVMYRPFWEFNYRDKQDVVILWRWAKPLDAEINAPKIFVDLHDVVAEGEFTESRLKKVNKIFVKTKFHRSLFPNVPDNKFAIVPNGMTLEGNEEIEKDPLLIINTSSPDRSLDVLPKMFEEIKKKVPNAKMQWCYGWEGFVQGNSNDPKKMEWMDNVKKEMEEVGIVSLGRLTQKEVGLLYKKAQVFLYPTEFAEIDCISVKKAQMAGAYAVTTDFGALKESNVWGDKTHSSKTKDTWCKPYQFHFGCDDEEARQQMIKVVVSKLKKLTEHIDKKHIDDWAGLFSWENIAKQWNKEFTK